MTFNEVRKDYLLDRRVVIATERGRRPTDFAGQVREKTKSGVCPMCPGNERMTPPAILLYLRSGKSIRKTNDKNGLRPKNWLIRVIPNLYPAFSPPKNRLSVKQITKGFDVEAALGHHEVLVESPIHDEGPAEARIQQLTHVINAYLDRLRDLSGKSYVKYVSIFRNHGLEAGASLSHAHSQIIAMSFIPQTVKEEMNASREFWKKNGECVFCNIIEKEQNGPRFILENSGFTVFSPYASVNPMEFWIFPKRHGISASNMSQSEVRLFAETLRTCLRALKILVNDPPYNFGFHLALDEQARDFYHWHLEVYPRLAVWAGFEKSTGLYINTMTPEMAAESLRREVLS